MAQLQSDEHIETAYLQLVMQRLWSGERKDESTILRRATFDRLGGAQRIVGAHLDDTMSALSPREQGVAAAVFHHLVTPSGTKVAHTIADLSEYTHFDQARISDLFDKLSHDLRILRPVAVERGGDSPLHYEIYHDALAPAILDWRARYLGRGVKWSVELDQPLGQWSQDASELSMVHYTKARQLALLSSVGIIIAFLAAFGAFILHILGGWDVGVSIALGLVCFLLLGQMALRLPERAERHRQAAAGYRVVQREIESTLSIRPELRDSDPVKQIDRLRAVMDQLAREAPAIGSRAALQVYRPLTFK